MAGTDIPDVGAPHTGAPVRPPRRVLPPDPATAPDDDDWPPLGAPGGTGVPAARGRVERILWLLVAGVAVVGMVIIATMLISGRSSETVLPSGGTGADAPLAATAAASTGAPDAAPPIRSGAVAAPGAPSRSGDDRPSADDDASGAADARDGPLDVDPGTVDGAVVDGPGSRGPLPAAGTDSNADGAASPGGTSGVELWWPDGPQDAPTNGSLDGMTSDEAGTPESSPGSAPGTSDGSPDGLTGGDVTGTPGSWHGTELGTSDGAPDGTSGTAAGALGSSHGSGKETPNGAPDSATGRAAEAAGISPGSGPWAPDAAHEGDRTAGGVPDGNVDKERAPPTSTASDQVPSGWAEVARGFGLAFTRTGVGRVAWFTTMSSWLTPEQAAEYRDVPVEVIPSGWLLRADVADPGATAHTRGMLTYDTGMVLQVGLSYRAMAGSWLVARVELADTTGAR